MAQYNKYKQDVEQLRMKSTFCILGGYCREIQLILLEMASVKGVQNNFINGEFSDR